jgi:murein DD-endopeptidase MepM/ murein hydrolase activator NlpD
MDVSGVMRKKFTSSAMPGLLKAATILSIGGLVAGCSSNVVRFNDGFYTGAIPTQSEVASSQGSYGQPSYSPGVDPSSTGSIAPGQVGRAGLPRPSDGRTSPPQPVGAVGGQAPLYSQQQQQPAAPTYQAPSYNAPTYNAPNNVSQMTTASVATQSKPLPAPSSGAGGWSSNGATQVTLREGETIYNLSRRYGVPADEIMKANGISDAKSVHVGQQIRIPTYVYSRDAGVSAPDKNPKVAKARSTVGTVGDAAPRPQNRPGTQVASLGKIDSPAPAPAPARRAVMGDGGLYTVVAGDTLSAISRRTGASVAAIKQVNSMSTDTVRIGQKLIIPGLSAEKSTVASAKSLDPVKTSTVKSAPAKKIAEYTPPTKSAKPDKGSIRKIETTETAKAPDSTGVKTMRWPVQGRVVSAFGSNSGGRANDGIDISVPNGTPVKAAENGVVIYAADGLKELGKTILVRHSDGVVTVYGHVSDIDVKHGQQVKRGQQIASSGMSGAAKQPQLHFEVRKNSAPVNPMTYLQ